MCSFIRLRLIYIGLKLPEKTLKTDLLNLMKSIPSASFKGATPITGLPSELVSDVRFISLKASVRDPFIEAYILTLQTVGSKDAASNEGDDKTRADEERRRQEAALAERQREVARDRRRQRAEVEEGREKLRQGEQDLEVAMKVGKRGIMGQLESS